MRDVCGRVSTRRAEGTEGGVLSCMASDTMSDNMTMERHDQEPSLGKLFLLALVSTRGTKLRYWKQILARLGASR